MLYKKTLLQTITIFFLLSGCTVSGLSLYKEPIDGPKARLRVESKDYYTFKSLQYGGSAIYVRPNISCHKKLAFMPPGYVTYYGNTLFVSKANKTEKNYQGISLNVPGEFKESMSDVYIPAGKPVMVSYNINLGINKQCGFGFVFIPEENKDYYAYFEYNPASQKCATSKIIDISGKEPVMVQTETPNSCPTTLERIFTPEK